MSRISNNIQNIQESLAACTPIGRLVTLVCVSKKQPVESLLEAYKAGIRDFGESRIQEFQEKYSALPADIRWHLIGTLQPNKVRKAVGHFYMIHSIDSLKLLQKVSSVSGDCGVETKVLLQVNTSLEVSKHGFSEEELFACFSAIKALPHIRVLGLMAMAPALQDGVDEEKIGQAFKDLVSIRDRLEREFSVHLPELSMGMSHDYV